MAKPASVFSLFGQQSILPVISIASEEDALPLVDTLVENGLVAIEITLRSARALAIIDLLLRERPNLLFGAGTVVCAEQLEALARRGIKFAVSPGITPALLQGARRLGVPFLPGVATPSDILIGLEHGWREFKFFPAENAGGPATLAAWAGPFPDIRFCPTGGVGPGNLAASAGLGNVALVGSSWMAGSALIAARDWKAIGQKTREIVKLVASVKAAGAP